MVTKTQTPFFSKHHSFYIYPFSRPEGRISLKNKISQRFYSFIGDLADTLENKLEFSYASIPHFPVTTVEGHAGKMVFGYIGNVPIVCMKGRFHYYEGHTLWKTVMPVRVMKLIGVTHIIITNSAGGLNENFNVGDVMLIKDHFNQMGLSGWNPLRGPNDERLGIRFPPMHDAYDRDLLDNCFKIANQIDGLAGRVHKGVYTSVCGPTYETVGEIRLLKMVGVDAVGMSTIPEVIAARHCGLKVVAFSLITDVCFDDYGNHPEAVHEDIVAVGNRMSDVLKTFVTNIVEFIVKSKMEQQNE